MKENVLFSEIEEIIQLKLFFYEFSSFLRSVFHKNNPINYPFMILSDNCHASLKEFDVASVKILYHDFINSINFFLDDLEDYEWDRIEISKSQVINIYIKMRSIFRQASLKNESLSMDEVLMKCFK